MSSDTEAAVTQLSVVFPGIYRTFKAKSCTTDGNLVNFVIQDLPVERYKDAIEFMKVEFLPDEPLCKAIGLCERPEAVQEIEDMWKKVLREKCSVVCFCEESDEIVAINFHVIVSRDRESEKIECIDEAWLNVYEVLNSADLNVFEMFSVDRFLGAIGLCVSNKYRSRGIATEMLKARVGVMQAHNLSLTVSTFTSLGAQKAAKRAGYEEIYSKSYDEINKVFPKFDFSRVASKYFQISSYKATK